MLTGEKMSMAYMANVAESIPLPFLVTDTRGEILFVNRLARSVFGIDEKTSSILAPFFIADQNRLLGLLTETDKNNVAAREIISLRLSSGKTLRGELHITPYTTELSERSLFISFNQNLRGGADENKLNITVPTESVAALFTNSALPDIIEDVRSSFPFTFLGKSKIQAEINKLEEFFWMKDPNGNYLMVNNRFSSLFRLRASQMEGKPERNFIPHFYADIHKSIESYMRETLNTVTVEGLPFKGLISPLHYRTIEIPVTDAENNILAVIGVAQNVQQMQPLLQKQSQQLPAELLPPLHALPVCAAIIDSDGVIRSATDAFSHLFELTSSTPGVRYHDALPQLLSRRLDSFITSTTDTFAFEADLAFQEGQNSLYSVNLTRIVNDPGLRQFTYLLLEPRLSFDSLEDLIKKKGRMFDILIHNNPEPIFIYDAENLRFLEVNQAALQLYGYKRDEFLQMDLTDLYTPEDIQTILDSNDERKTVFGFTGPFRQKKKDGTSVYVEVSRTKFLFENREAHFNIVRDISSRLDQEKQFQIFKATFDNTGDLVFITDADGFIKYANLAVTDELGYQKGMLEDSSLVSIAADDDRGVLNTSIFFSQLKENVEISVQLKRADGTLESVDLVATPLFDQSGEIENYSILGKRKPAAQEIIREVPVEKEVIKEVIKEVVREVKVEVPVYAASAPVAGGTHLDSAQISHIFHEILTPINVILGFVEEIKESIAAPSSEQREAIDYIHQNRENLLETMNSISEFAVLDGNQQPDLKVLKLIELLESVQNSIENIHESWKKELVFSKVSSSLKFESDEERFKTLINIVFKLICRVTKEDQVYVSAQQLENEEFLISFKDNLARCTDEVIECFEKFLSGDYSFARNFHLSKFTLRALDRVLKQLKGRVQLLKKSGKTAEIGFIFPILFNADDAGFDEFSSPPSQSAPTPPQGQALVQQPSAGFEEVVASPKQNRNAFPDKDNFDLYKKFDDSSATVRFRAPVQEPEPKVAPPASTAPVYNDEPAPFVPTRTMEAAPGGIQHLDLTSLNCLYIEDQVDSQILFKVQMKELHDIRFAVSFEEALPLLQSNAFDFIVMDINLQGEYNGLDALKIINQMPGFQDMPIIAVTAYVLPGDREKFIAAGFNDFISKPIFREKMIESLERVFRKKYVG